MVTILILSFLRGKGITKCIESLRTNSVKQYRIVVLQQGISGPTIPSGVEIVVSKENTGICKGRNILAQEVKTPYMLFLDDDCFVEAEWDLHLEEILKEHQPDALTCKLVETRRTKTIRECELIRDFKLPLRNWNSFKYSVPADTEIECTYVKGVSFHSVDCFRELGGFDEEFFISNEDADYSLRLLEKKKKVLYTPRVSIVHEHEFGDLEYEKVRWNGEIRKKSFERFNEKWANR